MPCSRGANLARIGHYQGTVGMITVMYDNVLVRSSVWRGRCSWPLTLLDMD